jgi:hypothetical protein
VFVCWFVCIHVFNINNIKINQPYKHLLDLYLVIGLSGTSYVHKDVFDLTLKKASCLNQNRLPDSAESISVDI